MSEKKTRKLNMLEVYVVTEQGDSDGISYPGLAPVDSLPLYTKSEFRSAVKNGDIDIEAVKLRHGLETVELVALRRVDSVSPSYKQVIML